MPVTSGVAAALLGTAVNMIDVVVLPVELYKADALGEVFTRKIDSLFKVTNAVPAVFAEAASLGA